MTKFDIFGSSRCEQNFIEKDLTLKIKDNVTEKQPEKKPRKKKLVTTILGPKITRSLQNINPWKYSEPQGSLQDPIENSIKATIDVKTKTLTWEDPYNLLCDDRKYRIEEFMNQSNTEMSNQIFDSLSDFHLHLRKEARPFVNKLVIQMCEHIDVTKKDKKEKTPIHFAALFDNEKGVSKLIQRGANLEASDEDGEKPLHLATRQGSEACCKALLERCCLPNKLKGANVNANSKNGYTCLMLAAELGYVKLVNLFLETGADTRMENIFGRTAAEIAKPNCVDIIESKKFMKAKKPKAQKSILKKL